jgi:hypothetical protein
MGVPVLKMTLASLAAQRPLRRMQTRRMSMLSLHVQPQTQQPQLC